MEQSKELIKSRSRIHQVADGRPFAPPLDHLTDVALLAIFGQFPVAELLQRKCLNVRLDGLQAEACRAQRKLNLLLGPDAGQFWSSEFEDELAPCCTLALGGLSMAHAGRLLDQMPQVRSLFLVLPRFQEVEMGAIGRLGGWSGSLRRLVLCIRHSEEPGNRPDAVISGRLLGLLAGINSLNHLKVLNFNLDGYLLAEGTEEQSLDLPILAHLEGFNFSSYDSARMLGDTMAQYLPGNEHLSDLCIHNKIDPETFESLLQMGPRVAHSFGCFTPAHGWSLSYHQLKRLCRSFPGIGYLNIDVTGFRLPEVARLLRPLKGLHTVILSFGNVQPQITAVEGHLQLVGPEQVQALYAVKQVSRLYVNVSTSESHQELDALPLELFFPNIKNLKIEFAGENCAICGSFGELLGRQDRPDDVARSYECIKATAMNLLPRFPLVQKVKVNRNGVF